MKSFGSDNHSGVHPQILQSLMGVNDGSAPAYGIDEWSLRTEKTFQNLFGTSLRCFFVFNGTGANVTCLRAMTQPWNSVLVSDLSHMNMDECAAPEIVGHCKLLAIPSQNAKISLETLKRHLIRRGDPQFAQIKAVSLTQPTELGTCYTVNEIREICAWAHANGLYVHIDGARIANAVVQMNTSFKEMFTDTGVDIISFGGTKNGVMMGEAVLILNPKLAESFPYIRKQSLQVPSKSRFVAAQFETYLSADLWRKISEHSLSMAQYLCESVQNIPGVKVTQPRQSNAVFAEIPQKWVKPLREKFFFYVWDELTFECRWMTSWDTRRDEIDAFVSEIKKLSKEMAP